MQEGNETINDALKPVADASSGWSFDMSTIWDKLIEYGTSLIFAVAILVIGFMITKKVTKMFSKMLKKKEFDASLSGFLISMVSVILKVLVVLTALGQLGIEMTSFIAIIGAAGLAIGMAFSGTLGNFAGGIMILIFRPYKVGDYIKAQGEEGIVQQIQIFNTIILTVDNKTIIVPNGAMANGNMTNFTEQPIRRVDFTVGIAYGDDYDKAKAVLERFIKEDDNIIQDQANFIGLGTLADSSVNITLRVWTKTENYWDVFFKMNEKIYKQFGTEGLNIPFPQMDVHVHNA
ncbi:mechanosensitive ion channel family protein [Crocinitomix catalasitica]|uniref:mechanosensitive ion channel family protein n=1 Tax=Crocinitomix catalasitica TaxID=184607 RepID=UPI000AF1CFAF|nr:mechanosensitive ion channel domain-containing protein [Crocinitomix catalasitica]